MSKDVIEETIQADQSGINRREFLKKTSTAGAALFTMPLIGSRGAMASNRTAATDKPNLLIVIVDEMRYPQWFPQREQLDQLLPNIARLRDGSVELRGLYAAATACSPSRATLLTGLYAHRNGIMLNQNKKTPSLNPGFKTWGSALRDFGYSTNWYGKWHLSSGDTLEPYGFDGGTYPSPNGGAQNGTNRDPHSVDQFEEWFDTSAASGPWATTISLLNPHDIMFFPEFTEDYLDDHPAAKTFSAPPPNIETTEQLIKNKPRMQVAHQAASDLRYGAMPTSGDGWQQIWTDYLNAYITYQCLADQQIGRVLDKLESNQTVSDNTIILFFSDHGEYGGSHGLRAKGSAVYEESIHVPFTVKDPTGRWTKHPEIPRTQLTSIVDIYGLLLTLASGSNDWRSLPEYAHLSSRLDVAALLQNPKAPGREYILHTSDSPPSQHPVPTHVIGYRTQNAKIGTYNYWEPYTGEIVEHDRDTELYDYSTIGGQAETLNDHKLKPRLFEKLDAALSTHALPNELRQPLFGKTKEVSEIAFQLYNDYVAALRTTEIET